MKTLISKKLKSGLSCPFKLYDENRNLIYYEKSDGYWSKSEYDERGNQIYFENSNCIIIDNRPKEIKEVTIEELEKHFNCKIKVIK